MLFIFSFKLFDISKYNITFAFVKSTLQKKQTTGLKNGQISSRHKEER